MRPGLCIDDCIDEFGTLRTTGIQACSDNPLRVKVTVSSPPWPQPVRACPEARRRSLQPLSRSLHFRFCDIQHRRDAAGEAADGSSRDSLIAIMRARECARRCEALLDQPVHRDVRSGGSLSTGH